MKKRLVYTVTFGDHGRLAKLTHPLIQDYARRHGADFSVLGPADRLYPQAHPSYEDFRIPEFLKYYDEIVHLDTDLIVANDTPWLLDQSGGVMCAVDESLLDRREPQIWNYATVNGKPMPHPQSRYFNLGVFGVTKQDESIWVDPENFWNDSMGHQSFINHRLIIRGHPIRDLGPEFNLMVFQWHKYDYHRVSYIKHYAGMRDMAWLMDTVKDDVAKLKSYGRA